MAEKTSFKKPPPSTKGAHMSLEKRKLRCGNWLDLSKSIRALALALSFPGKYREVATEVSNAELNSDDGMTILLAKLDQSFQKD